MLLPKSRGFYFFLTIVVFAILSFVLFKKDALFTSDEMKHLREIESNLNLPVPNRKSENDRGCNTDYKGATHYDRRIYLYYKDLESAFDVKRQIEENGWTIKDQDIYDTREMYWYYNDNVPEARMFLDITLEETINTNPHVLLISSTKDALVCR